MEMEGRAEDVGCFVRSEMQRGEGEESARIEGWREERGEGQGQERTLEVKQGSLKIWLMRRGHEFLEGTQSQLRRKKKKKKRRDKEGKQTYLNVLPHTQFIKLSHELIELLSVTGRGQQRVDEHQAANTKKRRKRSAIVVRSSSRREAVEMRSDSPVQTLSTFRAT